MGEKKAFEQADDSLGKFWQIGKREKHLLEQSLKELLAQEEKLVPEFFNRLFAEKPEVEQLFVNKHSKKMQSKIMQSLIYLGRNIGQPNVLVPTLLELGRRHESYGALAIHYPVAMNILLDAMESVCSKNWNSEIRSIWKAALQAASRVMLNAYHQGEAQDAGSQNRKENHGQEAAQTAE